MPYNFSEEAAKTSGEKKPRFEFTPNNRGYDIIVNTVGGPLLIGEIYHSFDGWARELALILERGK